jgi:hypothetical protein
MPNTTTNRDQAVKILAWFLQSIFAWIHKPWTSTEATLTERLVDNLIAAAADQAQLVNDGAVLLDELMQERPTQATTRRFRREGDDLYAEDDPTYQAWRQRSQQEDVRGILKREGR